MEKRNFLLWEADMVWSQHGPNSSNRKTLTIFGESWVNFLRDIELVHMSLLRKKITLQHSVSRSLLGFTCFFKIALLFGIPFSFLDDFPFHTSRPAAFLRVQGCFQPSWNPWAASGTSARGIAPNHCLGRNLEGWLILLRYHLPAQGIRIGKVAHHLLMAR